MNDPYREAVRNAWPPERLLEALEALADAEKTTSHSITCKCRCNATFDYKLPGADGPTRLKALQLISDLGYGKPAPVKPEEPTKPIALDVDPYAMPSTERKALIQQLRARLQEQPADPTDLDISQAV